MGGIADQIRAVSREVQVSHDFDRRVLRAMGYWQVTGRQVIAEPRLLRPLVVVAAILLVMTGLVRHYLARPYAPPARALQAAAMAPAAAGAAIAPDRDRR